MADWLRDPMWGGIGSLLTGLSIVLFVFVERRRLLGWLPSFEPDNSGRGSRQAGATRSGHSGLLPRGEDYRAAAILGMSVGSLFWLFLAANAYYGSTWATWGGLILFGFSAVMPLMLVGGGCLTWLHNHKSDEYIEMFGGALILYFATAVCCLTVLVLCLLTPTTYANLPSFLRAIIKLSLRFLHLLW